MIAVARQALGRAVSGAVVMREAARTSRRWQTYASRAAFSAVLFGTLLIGLWFTLEAPFFDKAQMGWMGRALFIVFGLLQGLLAMLLAPMMSATALIEEVEDRTLEMLVLTKLSTQQILSAKVISRVLLLLTVVFGSLPVLALVVNLGGVSGAEVVTLTVHMVVTVVIMGALGAFFGLFTRSPMLATFAAASYAVPFFWVAPVIYAMMTARPEDVVQVTPISSGLARDFSGLISPLVWLPSVVMIAVLGSRLFDLRVSRADIRKAFGVEVWQPLQWAILCGIVAVGLITVVPLAGAGAWAVNLASKPIVHPWADWAFGGACTLVLAGWYGLALAASTWVYLRVGVDVVDAIDALFRGGRDPAAEVRIVKIWRNPVLWREARLQAWINNGLPLLGAWLIALLMLLQTGIWLVPGGAVVLAWLNTGVAIGLAVWMTARTIDDERNRGTLEVLLTTTLPSWRILVGKIAGVVTATGPLMLISAPFLILGMPYLEAFDGADNVGWSLLSGGFAWMWSLPVWAFAIALTAVGALRMTGGRATFGLVAVVMGVVLGLPMLLGRFLPDLSIVAVPSRIVAPPLAGDASSWMYVLSASGFFVAAVGLMVWATLRLRIWVGRIAMWWLAIGLLLPVAAQAQDKPKLQDNYVILAEPVADGLVRADEWAALRVRIANVGESDVATLRLVESGSSGEEDRVYERVVELPAGARKDLTLTYRPGNSRRTRRIDLLGRTGRVAVAEFDLDPVNDNALAIGIVGTDPAGLLGNRVVTSAPVPSRRGLANGVDPRTALYGLIPPASMPDHSAAYAPFDWVVWPRTRPGDLAPDQLAALQHWVADGGHLFLSFGASGDEVKRSALAEMLPVRLNGVVDGDVSGLGRAVGQPLSPTVVPIARGTVAPASGRMAWTLAQADAGEPLWVVGTYGLGTVHVLLTDVQAGELQRQLSVAELWRRLLFLPQTGPVTIPPAVDVEYAVPFGTSGNPWESGAQEQLLSVLRVDGAQCHADALTNTNFPEAGVETQEIRSWLSDVPGLSPLPLSWLAGFSLVYLLVIGPMDFLVLRWLRREPWTWVTFPVTIVVFSAAALVGTSLTKGNQAMVSRAEVVDLLPGTSLWRGTQYVGVFAAGKSNVVVRSGFADGMVQPMNPAGFQNNPRLRSAEGAGALTYSAETWTMGYSESGWVAPAPGGLTVDVVEGGWAIEHDLPFALEEAQIVVDFEPGRRSFYPVGTVPPGKRTVVALGAPDYGLADVFGPEDWDFARRALLDWSRPDQGALPCRGVRAMLVARVPTVEPLAVDGIVPVRRDVTLLRVPLARPLQPSGLGATRAKLPGMGD